MARTGVFCQWAARVVWVVVCFGMAREAQAAARRVALVQADPELLRSVSIALTPWGVATLGVPDDPPGSSLPDAARRASDLARQTDAQAVVWISTSERGAVLWVYDAQGEEITTRILAGAPPFESSAAASVALSLKTLLRATEVAPESERFGAAPPASAPPRERWQLQIGAEDRFFASRRQDIRFMVGACWWWRPPPKGIGLAAEISAGPGASISDERFTGRFRDLGFGPALRWQVAASERVAAVVEAGPSLHITFLDGSLVADGAPASVQRVNVTLDAGAFFDIAPSPSIHLGLGGKASYLTGYQRYLIHGVPVLELWPVAAEVGLRIGVDVP